MARWPARTSLFHYRPHRPKRARTANGRCRERLERAQREGDLPASADCATLAAYVLTVLHGMAVQAKAGFERSKLEAIAAQAMAGWPSP